MRYCLLVNYIHSDSIPPCSLPTRRSANFYLEVPSSTGALLSLPVNYLSLGLSLNEFGCFDAFGCHRNIRIITMLALWRPVLQKRFDNGPLMDWRPPWWAGYLPSRCDWPGSCRLSHCFRVPAGSFDGLGLAANSWASNLGNFLRLIFISYGLVLQQRLLLIYGICFVYWKKTLWWHACILN